MCHVVVFFSIKFIVATDHQQLALGGAPKHAEAFGFESLSSLALAALSMGLAFSSGSERLHQLAHVVAAAVG